MTVVATSLVLLVAGYDTTGMTLSFLAYELSQNQEVQARLQVNFQFQTLVKKEYPEVKHVFKFKKDF